MDLNELLYHHQLAVMRADHRGGERPAEACLVAHYRRRIVDRLDSDGAQMAAPSAGLKRAA